MSRDYSSGGSRTLRENEVAVDCIKANALIAQANLVASEEKMARYTKVSRSVIRRILGRNGNGQWSVINSDNAAAFAKACKIELDAFQWNSTLTTGTTQKNVPSSIAPHAEKVRWGPSDMLEAGVRISKEGGSREQFIPWVIYREELELKLLPQLFADPNGYKFEVFDYHGKKDWVIKITDSDLEPYCWLWLGGDPTSQWRWDGLVRVGGNTDPRVWQTYQRFSDGSYRRVEAIFAPIEFAKNVSGV